MLSAVAARKAAQAALLSTQAAVEVLTENEEKGDQYSEEEIVKALRSSETKRRPSVDADGRRKKKRRKQQQHSQPQRRYYSSRADADKTMVEDVVDREDQSSSSSESVIAGVLRQDERAWSPSQARVVLSEESDGEDEQFVEEFSGYDLDNLIPAALDNGYPTSEVLTFCPTLNQNTFRLFEGEEDIRCRRIIVALSVGETLSLRGTYSLTVLRGAISVLGSNLFASTTSHQIFAPKCSPLPVIKAISSSSARDFADRYMKSVCSDSSIILLEDLVTGVEGLGNVCKLFEDTFGDSRPAPDVLGLSTAHLISSLGRAFLPFTLLPSWEKCLSIFDKPSTDPPIVLVKGSKRTGKSTLARTVLNRLLAGYRRVAFLECDVGQTEFTPPGLVSLVVVDKPIFGPAFTHPIIPYASHFIGSTSPRNSPSHYTSAIQSLSQTFKLDLQYTYSESSEEGDERIGDVVPLVVNTMGWTKGLGADLAHQIESIIEPTHILSVQGNLGEQGRFPSFDVEAVPTNAQNTRYSAADWRTISLVSYFHAAPSPLQFQGLPSMDQLSNISFGESQMRSPLCTWNTNLPLMAKRPYAINPRKALDRIVLAGPGTEDVVPSELGRVLNGAIVALLSCEPEAFENAEDERSLYKQNGPLPDPATSNCIGLALVRAVSPSFSSDESLVEERDLQILTPVPLPLLMGNPHRCLVKGEIELPVCAMLDHRDDYRKMKDSAPFLQWGRNEAPGAERRRIRRNLMRRAQM